MDADVLKMEEMIMGGGEAPAPAELDTVKSEETYTTIIIQNPQPPPVIQSCESHHKLLNPDINGEHVISCPLMCFGNVSITCNDEILSVL